MKRGLFVFVIGLTAACGDAAAPSNTRGEGSGGAAGSVTSGSSGSVPGTGGGAGGSIAPSGDAEASGQAGRGPEDAGQVVHEASTPSDAPAGEAGTMKK